MKRREFLRDGFLASAGVLVSAKFSPAQVSTAPRRVLIVGAGLAGLVAAYELNKLNFDVTILEAQSRSGGRVLTIRDFDENLYGEAGAARIPSDHDLTHKYVREFGLPLVPFYPSEQKFMRLKDKKVEPVDWNEFSQATAAVMFLDKQSNWQKIQGGNDLLPSAFAKKLGDKIRLNSPVVKIEQTSQKVSVTFKNKEKFETISGDFLLCAIPFTTLLKIEVRPGFSEQKSRLIETLKYDSASRVLLQTKSRFWSDQNLNGFAFGEDLAEIWNSTFGQNGTRGILQTYLRGNASLDLTARPEAERIAITVQKLEKFFPALQANFEKGFSKCWSEDVWVRGAWSHPNDKELQLGELPEGRVFFAGEHISGWASWMQGALQSGLRAVKQIKTAKF